jgi:antitoxin (DNA-binding transcriptional repressor) of toxin-antitoxin stability system
MTQITLTEAQQHLREIIAGLKPGEEVQIIQGDHPIFNAQPVVIARLIMEEPLVEEPLIEGHKPRRIPGQYEGKFIVPDDFNDPLPDDILDGFLNPADLVNP